MTDPVYVVDIEQRGRRVVIVRRQCCMMSMDGTDERVEVKWTQYGPTEVYAISGGSARQRRWYRRGLARATAQDPTLTFCGDWRRREVKS